LGLGQVCHLDEKLRSSSACSRRAYHDSCSRTPSEVAPLWWTVGGICQDFPLKANRLDLSTKTHKLLATGRGQPVMATTGLQVSLLDPVVYRLRGLLELAGGVPQGCDPLAPDR
jgi:hypothetical protein